MCRRFAAFFVAYRSLAPPLRCCLFALPLAFGALGFLLQILLWDSIVGNNRE